MKNLITLFVQGCALFGLMLSNANAAILVSYTFPSGSATATSTDTGVTANSFLILDTTNEGTTAGDSGFSSASGNVFIRGDALGANQTTALADDDYFSFTIQAANVGDLLDLDSLTFDYGAQTAAYSSLTVGVYVQCSVGGFGTGNPVLGSDSVTVPASNPATTYSDAASIDLSGLGNVSSITFQIRLSSSLQAADMITRLDNVQVNGSIVAVPEPDVVSSLALGLVALVVLRRRMLRKAE